MYACFFSKFDANLSSGDIGKFPATALYDFCNAFPTALHEWLVVVLIAYDVPGELRLLIKALYTSIVASSIGIVINSLF